MYCSQCQGIEEVFSQKYVTKDLADYRKKGPDATTVLLTEAIKQTGVDGLSLLDIGGGVGAVQYEMIGAGVKKVTSVDASPAYVTAATDEAARRGYTELIDHQHGNFVDLAQEVPAADIVTLNRVICCYPDMQKLVSLSAERARKVYGLVYPRETWWVKFGLAIGNFIFGLRKNPFRTFVHPTHSVEEILSRYGFKKYSYHQTLIWQVAVYNR